MLTTTQLCDLTGVSRRTLQDYNELGLLKPRNMTPGGYWLYAAEDAERLYIIQLLRRFGYTRKELRDVINDPDAPFEALLDSVQASLAQRREQLDGLMDHIARLRHQPDVPDDLPESDAPDTQASAT